MTSDAQPLSSFQLAASDTIAGARAARQGASGGAVPTGSQAAPSTAPRIAAPALSSTASMLALDVGIPVPDRPATATATTAAAGRSLRTQLFIFDASCVIAIWLVLAPWLQGPPGSLDRLAPALTAGVVALVALRPLGLYRSRRCTRRSDELLRISVANLLAAAGFAVAQVQLDTPSPKVLIAAAAGTVLLGTVRWEFGRYLRTRRAEGRYLRGVVLVGANEDARHLRTMLRTEPELGYVVAAVVGEGAEGPEWADVPSGRSIADIPRLAATTGATGIVVVACSLSGATIQQALAVAVSCGLHAQVWPGPWGVGSRRLRSVPIAGEPFFYVEPRPSMSWQMGAKRLIDVVGASAALVVAAPLLAVAAILIKLDDGGPVLYRDTRIGRNGKPFVTYKFRSMSPEGALTPEAVARLNERTDGPLFKATEDPRVTRVGRLLRSSSIDELPQLWNVLWGTMSLVGPRPALPSEVAHFDAELSRRHSVRPGLTGMWQVQARRNPSFHAYRRLDLRYVDDWSLLLDLAILVSTVPCVLSHAARELRARRRH